MQRMRWSTPGTFAVSIAALITANLVPLYGVLFRDWSLHLVVIMYWIESGIIGAFNVPKIAMARGTGDGTSDRTTPTINGGPTGTMSRVLMVPFFVFHYGLFWVVHGVFVFLLPLFAGLGSAMFDGTGGVGTAAEFGTIDPRAATIGAIALAISHGISFVVNFLGRREYLVVSPAAQMFSVYGRVFVLHATILGGAFLVGRLGTPLAALGILIVGKIIVDIGFHLREHGRAQVPAALATPA
jgi:hypothetical protein